jgi:hypothetical protein
MRHAEIWLRALIVSIDVVPFHDKYVDDAGALLAERRSTNLLASRFWPRQGFRPIAYRLVRRVDQRIARANPSAMHATHEPVCTDVCQIRRRVV